MLKKAKLNSGKLFECTEKKELQSPGITSDKLILHSGASTLVLITLLKNYSPQRSWPLIGMQRQQSASVAGHRTGKREPRFFSSNSVTDSFCHLEQVPSPLIPDLTTSQRY